MKNLVWVNQFIKILNEKNCSVFKLSTLRGGSSKESDDIEKKLQKMANVDPSTPIIERRKILREFDLESYIEERKKAKDLVSETLIKSDKSFRGFTRRNLENLFGNDENLLNIMRILAYTPNTPRESDFLTLPLGQPNPLNRLDPYFRLESRDQKVKIGPFLTEIK